MIQGTYLRVLSDKKSSTITGKLSCSQPSHNLFFQGLGNNNAESCNPWVRSKNCKETTTSSNLLQNRLTDLVKSKLLEQRCLQRSTMFHDCTSNGLVHELWQPAILANRLPACSKNVLKKNTFHNFKVDMLLRKSKTEQTQCFEENDKINFSIM